METPDMIKIGSLFDGSGGFPLAATLCGIQPVWASEVEPYPIAVTRSRLPHMRHLGSVTDIHGGEVEPVDIITFGSPCQDLSVAGKRAGLKHEANGDSEATRSGLFMEAVRIIKEMREATNALYPTFALWENVPGAFSSNGGEDFRTVLEQLIGICEPNAVMPKVPKGGWAYADSYCGDGWSLAYRVFDAQHWGVPQRRRRIHLVLDLRGERARKVLFERKGVRGYFAPSGSAGQGAAENAQGSPASDDREGNCLNPWDGQARRCYGTDGIFPTLSHRGGSGQNQQTVCIAVRDDGRGVDGVTPFAVNQRDEVRELGDKAGSIQAQPGMKQQTFLAYAFHMQQDPIGGDVSPCIGGQHQATVGVVEAEPVYCLQGNGIDRADTAGCNGKGWKEGSSYTLNTIDRPAVAYCMGNGQLNQMSMAEQSNTLDCMHDKQAVVIKSETPHPVQYIVRRLTPTECARLQGFPDMWGHPDKKDSFTPEEYRFWLDVRNAHAAINGKQVKGFTEAQMLKWYNRLHTDSAEYKMWGNGIALPPALYCMQGMAEAMRGVYPETEVQEDE